MDIRNLLERLGPHGDLIERVDLHPSRSQVHPQVRRVWLAPEADPTDLIYTTSAGPFIVSIGQKVTEKLDDLYVAVTRWKSGNRFGRSDPQQLVPALRAALAALTLEAPDEAD